MMMIGRETLLYFVLQSSRALHTALHWPATVHLDSVGILSQQPQWPPGHYYIELCWRYQVGREGDSTTPPHLNPRHPAEYLEKIRFSPVSGAGQLSDSSDNVPLS